MKPLIFGSKDAFFLEASVDDLCGPFIEIGDKENGKYHTQAWMLSPEEIRLLQDWLDGVLKRLSGA